MIHFLKCLLIRKLKQTSEIIRGLEASKTPEVKVKLPELKEKLVRLEGIRKCL